MFPHNHPLTTRLYFWRTHVRLKISEMKRCASGLGGEDVEEGIFNKIPDDVMILIFRRLTQNDQFPLCLLSKRFFNLIPLSITRLVLCQSSRGRTHYEKLLSTCQYSLSYLFILGSIGITDSCIKCLTNLTTLHVNYNNCINYVTGDTNRVTDSGIGRLTGLRNLFLKSDHISDDALVNMVNLTCLDISGCIRIVGSTLKNLTNLARLTINTNNNISNNTLSGLTQLTLLRLADNESITDRGISGLTNLVTLDLSYNNNITNNGLLKLTNLINLYLTYNHSIRRNLLTELKKLSPPVVVQW